MSPEERVQWAESAENDLNMNIRISTIRARAIFAQGGLHWSGPTTQSSCSAPLDKPGCTC